MTLPVVYSGILNFSRSVMPWDFEGQVQEIYEIIFSIGYYLFLSDIHHVGICLGV
ncbi:MAG: hypothetical protein LBQ98_06385 [Nitrososphaerota archaeon]|jgi:hypothetical protein|nr:hypothetical protein [Nitrososphaerota archaeon]